MNRISMLLAVAAFTASPLMAQVPSLPNKPKLPEVPKVPQPSDITFDGKPIPNRPPETVKAIPMIPRETLFGNPERSRVTLSPDGKMLAWLAPVDGVMNVWVAPAENLAAAKAVTAEKVRGLRNYQWAYNNTHILHTQDEGGDENWKVYSLEVATGKAKDLTPFSEIKGEDGKPIMLPSGKQMRPAARIEEVSQRFPDEILLGLNNRNPQYHDVHRCNIKTGELTLVQKNDEWGSFNADETFTIRLASKPTQDGGMEIFKADGKGGFTSIEKVPQADALTTQATGFDASGKTLYWIDSRGRDTGAVFAQNMETGEKKLIAEDARADAGGAIMHPKTGLIQAASFNYERESWKVLDEAIKPDLDALAKVADGDLSITARSQDDAKWTVAYRLDNGPIKYYLYDKAAKKATFLFSNQPKLDGLPLSHMKPVVIKASDGLNLVSYLTVPSQYDKNNDAKPDNGPGPMVLLVHGGPWARDSWGFNPYAQWLANRGYSVLEVNFRGSTGFGKKFLNAGNMEWAGKMHTDLIDAVNWAVDQKIARKDKVAIMGGSYGGYATLVGLTFTPDVFACGVDIVGPSNIITLFNSIPPYWAPLITQFTTRVGDHRTEDGKKLLESRSPINFVDKIKKPLLIGQGANDPRVKQAEADQIVAAMQKKNIPVTYVLYPDEGHGFARPPNNKSFNAVTELFLAEHLGGSWENIGKDFEGSTITVPAGQELIPGLSEGLAGKK